MPDKIDTMLEQIRELRRESQQHWDNHVSGHNKIDQVLSFQNGRIKKLEIWRAYIIGIAIGASGITTGAILKFLG